MVTAKRHLRLPKPAQRQLGRAAKTLLTNDSWVGLPRPTCPRQLGRAAKTLFSQPQTINLLLSNMFKHTNLPRASLPLSSLPPALLILCLDCAAGDLLRYQCETLVNLDVKCSAAQLRLPGSLMPAALVVRSSTGMPLCCTLPQLPLGALQPG